MENLVVSSKSKLAKSITESSSFYRILFFTIGIALLAYYQFKGLGNDFGTFYSAGKKVQALENPWDVNKGNQYSAFLNGPLTATILGLASYIPMDPLLLITRLLTIGIVPSLIQSLGKILGIKIKKREIYVIAIFVVFTFPVRACLEYGQLSVIFSGVVVWAMSRINDSKGCIILGMVSYLALDFKPQVFLPLIFVVFINRIFAIIGFLIAFITASILNYVYTKEFYFRVWIDSISERTGPGVSSDDQMSLYSFFPMDGFIRIISMGMVSLFIICAAMLLRRDLIRFSVTARQLILLLCAWGVITPFSHPTDFIIQIACLLMLLNLGEKKRVIYSLIIFLAGLSLVWSNNPVSSGAICVLLFQLLLLKNPFKIEIKNFLFLLPSATLSFLMELNPSRETNYRQLANFIAVATASLTIHFMKPPRSKVITHGKLKNEQERFN